MGGFATLFILGIWAKILEASSFRVVAAKTKTTNPYHILVSEIMLQQTQVDRVIPYYEAFLKSFPTWNDLANAKKSNLLKHWQGLGYNSRVLRMQKLAIEIE